MYEHFRNEVISKLAESMSEEEVNRAIEMVDIVSSKYDIKEKELQLVPYEYGMPELAKTYLVCRSIEGLSKATLIHYHGILHLFFSGIRKNPQEITTNDIRAWLYGYQRARGISNRTLDGYRTIINSFFTWALNEEYIAKNPCFQIRPIKYTRRPRKALDTLELEYLRSACNTPKETAIIEVLYSTGCRVSELSVLKKSDIDWTKREVTLFGKGSKYRTSYLNAKAVVALERYLATRDDDAEYVFVTDRRPHHKIGKEGLERIVRIIYSRVGEMKIPTKVTPHILRHTTATIAVKNGMPIQDIQLMLGHSNISTTMIYAEVSQSEVKGMHQRCVV